MPNKPDIRPLYLSTDETNRREVVASVVNFCNGTQEAVAGNPDNDVTLPGQANTDDRMPLTFFRQAIVMLNTINDEQSLGLTPLPVPEYNLDYSGFVSLANAIIAYNNQLIGALP